MIERPTLWWIAFTIKANYLVITLWPGITLPIWIIVGLLNTAAWAITSAIETEYQDD